MSYTQIQYKQDGEIARIHLHRPDKLNALTPVMTAELHQCLQDIAATDEIRVVIVGGSGRAWSAGVDLAVFQEIKVEPGYDMHEDGMGIMRLLENMPQVTIAAVNGYSFTGAMELMMAFDLIIAADEAKIGDTHTKWGIPPKWGMTQRLQRQVGLRKAKELSFTAEAVSGAEAERIGLVNKSVPLTELQAEVDRLAAKILANSKAGVRAIKELYQGGYGMLPQDAIQYEQDYKMSLTDDKADDLLNFKDNI